MARTLKSTWATLASHKGGEEVDKIPILSVTSSHGLIDRMATSEETRTSSGKKGKMSVEMSMLNNNSVHQ